MSDFKTIFGEGSVEIELDEGLYPKDAIYGAAYAFIDRCFVHLDRVADQRIKVTMRAKSANAADTQGWAGEFQNELLGQAWRRQIVDENKGFIEAITTRALGGAAGPPGLDELLAMDINEESAFEDPLGIAMSWEEKYTKKKGEGAKAEGEAAKTEAEPAKGEAT
jgi:His-Xaa-Ser system protein HxsD